MPGYVIHLAIAKKHLQRYNQEDKKEFEKGVIFPDLTENKIKTHYRKTSAYINLEHFLSENKLDNSFNRGKFCHLITDYLFYSYFLNEISKEILHKDYDRINRRLMKKYGVELLEEIKNEVFFEDTKTEILDYNKVCEFIEEVSELNLDKVAEEVKNREKKWTTYNETLNN